MIHKFETYLLKKDGTYRTQTINGEIGIVIRTDKDSYDYEEIKEVVDRSYYLDRIQYGWDVKFLDADGQHKTLFIRSSHIETSNDSTSSYQTVYEWIDHIYGREEKQIDLF